MREGVVGGVEAGRHGVRAGGVESWGRGHYGRGWGRQRGGAEVCLVGEGGEDSGAGLGGRGGWLRQVQGGGQEGGGGQGPLQLGGGVRGGHRGQGEGGVATGTQLVRVTKRSSWNIISKQCFIP